MTDLRQPVEMEFRDGKRSVPDYLALMLGRFETHRLTFDEALALANRALEADLQNGEMDRIRAASLNTR